MILTISEFLGGNTLTEALKFATLRASVLQPNNHNSHSGEDLSPQARLAGVTVHQLATQFPDTPFVKLRVIGFGSVDRSPRLGSFEAWTFDGRRPSSRSRGLSGRPDRDRLTEIAHVFCPLSAWPLIASTSVSFYELPCEPSPLEGGEWKLSPHILISAIDVAAADPEIDVLLIPTRLDFLGAKDCEDQFRAALGDAHEKGKLIILAGGERRPLGQPAGVKVPASAAAGVGLVLGALLSAGTPHPLACRVSPGLPMAPYPSLWAPGEFEVWNPHRPVAGHPAGLWRRGSHLAAACTAALACRLLAMSRKTDFGRKMTPSELRRVIINSSQPVSGDAACQKLDYSRALADMIALLDQRPSTVWRIQKWWCGIQIWYRKLFRKGG